MNFEYLQKITKEKRSFNAELYLQEKIDSINKFFSFNKIDSAIIGLSGGIDSSLVFALLIHASKQENSPIKKVLGLIMPIYGNGTSGQSEAKGKAYKLENILNDKSVIEHVDLTKVFGAYKEASMFNHDSWSYGQLASIVRTPCLYYYASILQSQGLSSIVVGTTNRDEGGYIGFFGKASDAMVDLQPIADIHKSEVYEVAKLLNVPTEIINRIPKGDVYDGKSDEEMIGAPYWFLEMYILMKEYGFLYIFDDLIEEDKNKFKLYAKNIEELHKKNSHKYITEDEYIISPRGFAHYIDCMYDHKIIIDIWKKRTIEF